jgi:hypothetical protein
MMGGRTPETCWVVNKRQDNKLENCCVWLVGYLNCFFYISEMNKCLMAECNINRTIAFVLKIALEIFQLWISKFLTSDCSIRSEGFMHRY